jgi:hypothetical protein
MDAPTKLKKDECPRIMPENELDTQSTPRAIHELVLRLREFQENPQEIQRQYPWADRFVCGIPLASWQRQLKWSDAMQIDFIDSIWHGLDLGGSYMVNGWYNMRETPNGFVMDPLSDIVIDGQQRLMSIQRYYLNEIPVKAKNGDPLYYADLPRYEQLRFLNSTFTRSVVHSHDEAVLRAAYDKRNFSGVPHTEDERALPNFETDMSM